MEKMTEYKRFKLGDFDSVCEMLELLNTQRLVVSDMEKENQELKKENEQLKKELFQSEKEYLYEAYAGNSVRRDNKIKALEDEFNERFGDDWRND